VVIGAGGAQLGIGRAPHAVRSPQEGWAESDPADWWRSVTAAVQEAFGQAARTGELRSRVGAIGLSGQMHGAVLADERGEAVRPAVLWADERAEIEFGRYARLDGPSLRSLANPLVAGMTGPVLCWLAEFEKDVFSRASWALQCKDWLRLRLTGIAGSEPTDASGTLLFDLPELRWAAEVASCLGISPSLFAPLGGSTAPAGELTPDAAGALGLRPGVPVVYGAADTAAAIVGNGVTEPGEIALTVGTAAQLVTLRAQAGPDPGLRYHLFAAARGGYYALAAVQAVGLAFDWAWATLGCDWPTAYSALAESPPGANGVSFVPHVAGARSPRMDARASGSFAGLRLHTRRADVVRAVFEGVAFSVLEAALCLPEYAGASQVLLAGGGSTDPRWRQLLADVIGRPLLVLPAADASARGAALLAAAAAGIEVAGGPHPAGGPDVVQPAGGVAGRLGGAYELWCERASALGVAGPARGAS